MANRKTANARKREKFLSALKASGNVSSAAKRAALSRRIAYVWRDDDPVFAMEWEDAVQEYCDTLEAEAGRRAVEGVPSRLKTKPFGWPPAAASLDPSSTPG